MPTPSTAPASTHVDFPNGMEVINTSQRSRYFGQRGVVYGSGPSQRSQRGDAVIFVRWPDGERFKYFPSRLAPAPLRESEYRQSNNKRNGRRIEIHQVPATTRGRPTIFERVATQRSGTSTEN